MEDGVVVSPIARDPSEVPEISLMDFFLPIIRETAIRMGDTPWMVDVINGTSVKFSEVEEQSLRVASALARLGFKQRDLLYFQTYEMAQLYIIKFAVWRLGGTVRGWIPHEPMDIYVRHLNESRPKFMLMDWETAPVLREASTHVDWNMKMLSVGTKPVEGTTSFLELLQDDGSACPQQVKINPREDVLIIPCTSGSTGPPKGILHTHYSAVAFIMGSINAAASMLKSTMSLMVNFSIGNFMGTLMSLHTGFTVYNIGKFDQSQYIDLLLKFKPESAMMYPYLACWFAKQPRLQQVDLSFLKVIWIGAWVLDPSTVENFVKNLPAVKLVQGYGMSECMGITSTMLRKDLMDPNAPALPMIQNQGTTFVSTGRLMPYVKAKVIDPESKKPLARGERGEIMINAPTMMRGYLVPGGKPDCSDIEEGGWLHTGDLGFIDEDGNIVVIERLNFTYKYKTAPVSPCEIEAVLLEHPAVESAGVVGIPNVETDNLSKGYVVLRSGCNVTAEELQQYVASRLSGYKHLHGGVYFLQKLPQTHMGKLDRNALKKIALAEKNN